MCSEHNVVTFCLILFMILKDCPQETYNKVWYTHMAKIRQQNIILFKAKYTNC